jgi:prophage tail gpP-like protein
MPFKPQLVAVPEDPVKVVVDGFTFAEWQEVDIDSDVFTAADGFSLTGTVPSGTNLSKFREGARVDVYVGPDRQMAGVIDTVQIKVDPKSVTVSISGRDLGAYLCDCEVQAREFKDQTLSDMVKALLKPSWGIRNVISDNDDNRRILLGKKKRGEFKKGIKQNISQTVRRYSKIDAGSTARSLLDQWCAQEGVTWWITAQGDLFIGRPQYDQDPVFEFYLFGPTSTDRNKNNVLSATVERSMGERYSEIVVTGTAHPKGKAHVADATNVDEVPDDSQRSQARSVKLRGNARDADLESRGITRTMTLHDDGARSNKECSDHAAEQVSRRELSALKITVEVDGFRQGGRVFTTDCLANVKIEQAGIDGVYWISQRKFTEKRQERRTSLTLHEAGVYLS